MGSFNENPNFEREMQKEINDKVNAELGRFAPAHAGQPVEAIKPELDRAMQAIGLNLADKDLIEWSAKISDGTWQ